MTPLTQASIEASFKNDDGLKNAAEQIANDLCAKRYDISQFVESLGFALTSPTLDVRVNGTKLLSHSLGLLPKEFLTAAQLEFLATFYADRLKDQHNVIPSVINGIDALVTMRNFPKENVPKLLRTFFEHTSCQAQVRNDRANLFRIFKYLSEHYSEELKSMSGDFIYGIINSIDGERDPRNLDYIFSFMPNFIASYPLLHLSEEMFEIFACYFPIDFNPSQNDPASITRDALAVKLTNCLVSSPDFVEWTIALALEKLESDLIVAKLDSLELLVQSAIKFSPDLLEPHFEQIWTALKTEIFPGSDNSDVIGAGLRVLRTILEQASAANKTISHNYQTSILGTILPHLSNVNQRLFNPSTAIALVCVSGDPSFAAEKVLNSFLLKLQSYNENSLPDQDRIKMYLLVSQVFKITSLRNALDELKTSTVCKNIHEDLIKALRQGDDDPNSNVKSNLDLKKAALCALSECVTILSEANRALIYKALVQLITSEEVKLEFTFFLEQLGALYPIELQSNCIDICIRNFAIFSNFVKSKIYANLLPLVKQMAFSQRVLDLILTNVFATDTSVEVRLLALDALNELLGKEDKVFIEELQNNSCLIDKLVVMMKEQALNSKVLEAAAAALSLIIKQLPIAEQYMIITEYLPTLKLKLETDLYIAKGLLGYLHQDLSLDDHFERLLSDLTELSMESDDPNIRMVSSHLLCSLVNKIEYTDSNRSVIRNIISKLKQEIKLEKGKAVEVLSWIGKGLIVRDCTEAGDVIDALAELLDHPALSTVVQLAFEIISTEYPELHLPIVKFLFKQKFFHMLMSKLGHKLESFCEHHLNAFIYVLNSTPHAVLKMNLEKIGPILFKCLESPKMKTVCISLEICENFISQHDEYFRSHLNHIIPCCLQLSKYKESMNVRMTSLQLLHDITKYPTYVLLPFKMDVVLELAQALDDSKRLVRNAAVKARNAWYLVGAPSTEE